MCEGIRGPEGSQQVCKKPISQPEAEGREITCEDLAAVMKDDIAMTSRVVVIDVRDEVQYDICKIDGTVNISLERIRKSGVAEAATGKETVYVLCRRGVNSRIAQKLLKREGVDAVNVRGGLEEWRRTVDDKFPVY